MEKYIKIGIATGARISMETNLYLSRRDFIKTAGVIAGSMALAACSPNEAPKKSATEYAPQLVDISGIHPDGNVFLNKEFFGRVVDIREFEKEEIEPYTESMVKAAREMGWNDTNIKLEYTGIVFVDQTGLEVPVIIAYATPIQANGSGSKQAFMYTAFSEEDLAFVPVNQTNEQARGRFFPIFPFQNDDSNILNLGLGKIVDLEKIQLTVPMFTVEYNGDGTQNITAREPYSQTPFTIKNLDIAPEGLKKVIAELVPVDENYKELLKKFDGTGFTLSPNGEIKIKNANTEDDKVIAGIKIKPDGSATIEYQGKNKDYIGKVYDIDAENFIKNFKIEDECIVFTDNDDVTWTYDKSKDVMFQEITRDMEHPEEFPIIDLGWALTSPEFFKKIKDFDSKNRLSKKNGEEKPLEPGDLIIDYGSRVAKNSGLTYAFDLSDNASVKYSHKDNVPFQIVAIYNFKTSEGLEGNLIVERVTDLSDESKFRLVIEPSRKSFEDLPKQLLAMSGQIGYANGTFPCGYLILSDKGLDFYANNTDLSQPDAFKTMYKKHEKLFREGHNVYEALNKNGHFDNTNGFSVVIAGGRKVYY